MSKDYPLDFIAETWREFQAIKTVVFNSCDGIRVGGVSASAKDTEFKYCLVIDRKLTKPQTEKLLWFVMGASAMYRKLN